MRYRGIILSALTMFCGLVSQAQEQIDYYNVDFSNGIPTEMSAYDLDSQTLHYTMIQAGFKQGEAWIGKRENKSENRYAASACRYKEVEGETLGPSNDWLVSPAIWVRDADAVLKWKGSTINAKAEEGASYEVRISTEGDKPEDFTQSPVFTTMSESVNSWTEHEFSLHDYAGQRVYIAFVNNSATGEILGIDDVLVAGSKGVCDLVVNSDRYIFEHNDLTIRGYVEACSDEVVTDVTIKCVSSKGEVEATYGSLSLTKGQKYEFEMPAAIQLVYGEELDYQVIAVVNNAVTTDPVNCQATALMQKFHKNIVVEEATGMWCTYCPAGIVAMEELEKKYPESFIGLALHYNDQLAVDDYVSDLSFPDGFPTGWINRRFYCDPMVKIEEDGQTKYTMLNGGFETYYLEEMTLPAVAEINVSAEPSGSGCRLKSDVRFAMNATDADYRIAYVVIENDVTGEGYYQVNGYSGQDVDMGGFEDLPATIYDIKFQHVVRQIYDDYQGVVGSVPSEFVGGETYTHEYVIEMPKTVDNIDNVEVVAMLIDMKTETIVNADKIDVSASVATLDEDAVAINCVARDGVVRVDVFGEVLQGSHAALYDVHGRLIEVVNVDSQSVEFAHNCSAGVYVVVLTDGDRQMTEKIIVR
ncbi:MAG: choice-of-anchor J domain-containing protein [Muribaculaceae bacterium]|nr:choice-of-anchor J domain-containing protein [Muribaculaceae bacterium]